jgi:Domain of unknown function (DUF5753)
VPPARSRWFVVHESALRTTFVSKTVMRDQMDMLLEVTQSPRVVVQVFPSGVPDCPGVDSAVTIFDFQDESSIGTPKVTELASPSKRQPKSPLWS